MVRSIKFSGESNQSGKLRIESNGAYNSKALVMQQIYT